MRLSKAASIGLVLLSFLNGCTRQTLESRGEAMRLGSSPDALIDDLGLESLAQAIQANRNYLLENQTRFETLQFGDRVYSNDEYVASLLKLEVATQSEAEFRTLLREEFDFLEVYGSKKWGQVYLTSYFEPLIQGSKKKTKKFSQPIYGVPKDLVRIRLSDYGEMFKDIARVITGRISNEKDSQGASIIKPYFKRAEIDSEDRLSGQKLELVYADPIDVFFLQIQGSGTVALKEGVTLRVGYAHQNGHEYVAIGRFLTDHIPLEEMTLQRIEDHLRSLPEQEAREILNRNESYIFFRELETRPISFMGAEVIDGRTIATDERYFPKGGLAFLSFERPTFDEKGTLLEEGIETSRFVIDQDRGGAIRGGGRVDLFWGMGDEAKRIAGALKGDAKLWYIVPKKN